MKRFLKTRCFRVIVGMTVLCCIVLVGLEAPRSPLGHLVFHAGYVFPPTRPAFLKFYQWSLRNFEGGYLPSSVDEFLASRLYKSKESREEVAIIDFQIRQGSGRRGDSALQAHQDLQRQIIENILGRLDGMEDRDAVNAMVYVESLRRNSPLRKGGFTDMWTYEDRERSLNRSAFEEAKREFKSWWGDGSAWPTIRDHDPLSESYLSIEAGP